MRVAAFSTAARSLQIDSTVSIAVASGELAAEFKCLATGGNAMVCALEDWVERGVAPDVLTVYHLKKEQSYLGLPRPVFPMDPALTDWSRPVFPYPYYAKYKGSGDPLLPSSWAKARLTIAGPER